MLRRSLLSLRMLPPTHAQDKKYYTTRPTQRKYVMHLSRESAYDALLNSNNGFEHPSPKHSPTATMTSRFRHKTWWAEPTPKWYVCLRDALSRDDVESRRPIRKTQLLQTWSISEKVNPESSSRGRFHISANQSATSW